MKKLPLLAALLFAVPAFAQYHSGIIQFEEKMDLTSVDVPEEMKAFFPKEQKAQKVLYYNSEQALYENDKEAKNQDQNEFEQDGIKIRMEQNRSDEKVFLSFKNGTRVEQKDLMGRMFLIKDSIEKRKWKFTGRQKNILNMPCEEAVSAGAEDTLTAWYTTKIPVPGGPKEFGGLPGMILEINMGNNYTIKAKSIKEQAELAKKIKEPTKGKVVTAAEYTKLDEEKQAELQKQYGGGNNVIIRKVNTRN